MTVVQSLFLGIIQGIGEFLPISSSAHLIVIPFLLNWKEHTIAFDVALHFGTLISVVIFFWKDWLNLIIGAYKDIAKKEKSFESRMFWYLVLATIPGAIIGKLFENQIETAFRNPAIIAITLGLMGIALYIGDKYSKSKDKFEDLTFKQTFIIGLSQALAIIPGFSRSGTTMLTARLLGATRETAARFSFLLATPIIFAAAILKLPDMVQNFDATLVIGIVTAAVAGVVTIKFLLEYLKKGNFAIFAVYRVVIAIVILVKCFWM